MQDFVHQPYVYSKQDPTPPVSHFCFQASGFFTAEANANANTRESSCSLWMWMDRVLDANPDTPWKPASKKVQAPRREGHIHPWCPHGILSTPVPEWKPYGSLNGKSVSTALNPKYLGPSTLKPRLQIRTAAQARTQSLWTKTLNSELQHAKILNLQTPNPKS